MGARSTQSNPQSPRPASAIKRAYEVAWREFPSFCRQRPDGAPPVRSPLALPSRAAGALVDDYFAWLRATGVQGGRLCRADAGGMRRHAFLSADRKDPTWPPPGPGNTSLSADVLAEVRSRLDAPAREVLDLLATHPLRADQLGRHRRPGNGGRR